MIKHSLRIFLVEPSLYDKPGLQGPVKHAELVVKMGYWYTLGLLKEDEFRTWADSIPPEDNAGWDVDLLHTAPTARFQRVLKIGPWGAQPDAGRMQARSDNMATT